MNIYIKELKESKDIKTKEGLLILDTMLTYKIWEKNKKSFSDVFQKVDVDWIINMISTDINGSKIIEEYDSLLQNEIMIKQLNTIQNNINNL